MPVSPLLRSSGAFERLRLDHPLIFSDNGDTTLRRPQTVQGAIDLMERMLYQSAASIAPTAASKAIVYENTPVYIEELEVPNRPPMIAPVGRRDQIVVTREAEAAGGEGYLPWWLAAALAGERQEMQAIEESPEPPPPEEPGESEQPVKVEFLADETVTGEMHDDTTVLRNVEDDSGNLVLFDALHIWAGGAVQFDAYRYEDLLNLGANGDSETNTAVRRAEVIVRSRLFDLGEIKWQYDVESNLWRDLYWRWVSEETSRIVTVGNQKEPFGMDYQVGSKFGTRHGAVGSGDRVWLIP